MAKIDIPNISSPYASQNALNERFKMIEDVLNDKVLWRDNPIGEVNTLKNDIDMGNNDLLNVGLVSAASITVQGQGLEESLTEAIQRCSDEADRSEAASALSEANKDATQVLRDEVEQMKASVSVDLQSIIDEGTAQVARVTTAGGTQISAVTSEGDSQVARVSSEGSGIITTATQQAGIATQKASEAASSATAASNSASQAAATVQSYLVVSDVEPTSPVEGMWWGKPEV